MRNHRGSTVAAITLLWTLNACGGDDSATASGAANAVTLRDSAGIAIIENHDSTWTAETRWSIAADPDLVIGSVDGSVPGTDWGQMVTSLLDGDRLVVSERLAGRIHLFDSSGTFLRSVGSLGQGPLEFTFIETVGLLPADTVAIFDRMATKMVRFDLNSGNGTSVATGEPPSDFGAWSFGFSRWALRGWFGDGSYIFANMPNLAGMDQGAQTVQQEWHRMAATGEHLELMDRLPYQEMWSGGGYPDLIPFTPTAMHHVRGSSLWHAFPLNDFSFRRYDLDRGLAQIVRADVPLEPVTPSLMTGYWDVMDSIIAAARGGVFAGQMMAEIRESQAQMRSEVPTPEFVSPFVRMIADQDQYLWLELSTPELRTQPVNPELSGVPADLDFSWAVFDSAGRWLGTVTTPPGLYVTDISADYIVGVRKDDLDVRFVERYRIVKPQ